MRGAQAGVFHVDIKKSPKEEMILYNKKFCQVCCRVSAIMAVCLPVWSAPSGLNAIPTTDVLDPGVRSLEMESAGTGNPRGSDCDGVALLQCGIGYGVELGVDRSTSSDSDYWINVKWRVRDETGAVPAVAFGTQSISDGDRPQHFAVATKSFGLTRLHSGIIGIEHKTRWMLGVDHPLGNKFTFMSDYINDDENSATFGLAVNLNDSLSLTVARSLGNSANTGNGYIVNIAWSTALK